MDQDQRVRHPHLIAQANPLDYTWADTWDASTPDELHAASYGAWLGGFSRSPRWAATTTRTIFLSPARRPDVENMVWQVAKLPDPFTMGSCYARKLQEGKVTKRAWLHMALDLPIQAAIFLSFQHTLGPVIFLSKPDSWEGLVLPAVGPSSSVNVLDARAVSQVLNDFLVELLPHPKAPWEVWLQTYGFNPIPEFKRLFELRQ